MKFITSNKLTSVSDYFLQHVIYVALYSKWKVTQLILAPRVQVDMITTQCETNTYWSVWHCFTEHDSWKGSGSTSVQEASFAFSCGGKLGLDYSASWLVWSSSTSIQCQPGSNSKTFSEVHAAMRPLLRCPEFPSVEVRSLCQSLALNHSSVCPVVLTEPVILGFIKSSYKTEMNLFYPPSISIAVASPRLCAVRVTQAEPL